MLLPKKVKSTQPTLADYLLVRRIEILDLAKSIGRDTRRVREWASGTRCPQLGQARHLAGGLKISLRELSDLLAGTRDARDETLAQQATRTISAALQFIASQPKDRRMRRCLRKLGALATRMGKKPMRLVAVKKPILAGVA